jgi:phosphoserine phosphatase
MRLIFFDLDGTLLPGTTASLEIARATGTTAQLLDLERAFSAGQCTTHEFAHAIARLWSDASVMTIAKAFSDTPKMSNIEPTLQFVRDLGWRSCLITMSPMFFASECRAWGFDFIFGSQFEKRSHPFVVGPPLNILRPEDKVLIAEQLCVQLGATLESCCAFGDSLSDFYLFERVGFSVAVNGTAALREKASASYEGQDLLESFHTLLRMMGYDDMATSRARV